MPFFGLSRGVGPKKRQISVHMYNAWCLVFLCTMQSDTTPVLRAKQWKFPRFLVKKPTADPPRQPRASKKVTKKRHFLQKTATLGKEPKPVFYPHTTPHDRQLRFFDEFRAKNGLNSVKKVQFFRAQCIVYTKKGLPRCQKIDPRWSPSSRGVDPPAAQMAPEPTVSGGPVRCTRSVNARFTA